jgi:hypothetical protein
MKANTNPFPPVRTVSARGSGSGILSLTPCFSEVCGHAMGVRNRFNGFSLAAGMEAVETVPACLSVINTPLKRGVNESGPEARP